MDKHRENPHNVVAMTEFRTEIGYSAISQVEGYWEDLRGMRMMPKRSEIDPRGIETALEYTFVLERIAPGMARLRIAGSHLSDLMGMEVRGMPMTSFITPSGRRQLSDALEEVFQRPAVCELRLAAESGRDKPIMDARMILLPLKSDLGDVSRILGCFVARGDIGRSPRRFDVVGAKIRPITASATAPASQDEPTAKPKPTIPTQIKGFAEDKPPFEEAPTKQPPTKGGGAPYLRLVKSED
ncbi:MAG: PAS domain-containing protein [Paracoccaceae bacterium]